MTFPDFQFRLSSVPRCISMKSLQILLSYDEDKWQALVSLGLHTKRRLSWSAERLVASGEGICHMNLDIVTHMTIARQRLSKHIPGVTLSTIGENPLLDNKPITNILDNIRRCFPCGPCQGIIRKSNSEAGAVRVQKNVRSRTENENENGACPSDLWIG
jgi:hypothetical protein